MNEAKEKVLPSPKMSYTCRKNNNIRPHNDRKETNIHKVQKTLVKIKSPKGNCLEARPKSMDEIKCTWVTIKRSKTMDQTKKKKR